jgi:hypothetical protein
MRRAASSPRFHRIRTGRTRLATSVSLAAIALSVVIGERRPTSLEAPRRDGGDSLTFAADVAPILYRNCVTCHRPGGIAPFSMLDFDTVTGRLKDLAKVLHEGKMPPWFAVAPPGTFRNERGLSDAEKRIILRWIATGASFGDSARLPAPPSFPDGWEIGTPDAVFTMQEAFQVPARGTIDYMHFQVPCFNFSASVAGSSRFT